MKNVVLGALIVALGGLAAFWYVKANEAGDNAPNFGRLFAVNRVVLVNQPYSDNCTHTDKKGWGKGVIKFHWNTEFGYGLDLPQDHVWDIQEPEEGKFLITLPPLKQLHPLRVEFYDFDETNAASGNRWERMLRDVRKAARTRMERASQVQLGSDRKLRSEARKSAERFFGSILKEMLPDGRFRSVTVKFDPPTRSQSRLKLITAKACIT